MCVTKSRRCRRRVKLYRPPVGMLCRFEIAFKLAHHSARYISLGQRVVQLHRAVRGLLCPVVCFLQRKIFITEIGIQEVRISKAGIGKRVIPVLPDRLTEILNRFSEIRLVASTPKIISHRVVAISLGVRGEQSFLTRRRTIKPQSELLRYLRRNRILKCEDVAEGLVEFARPDWAAVFKLPQHHGYANAFTHPLNCSAQNGVHGELSACLESV